MHLDRLIKVRDHLRDNVKDDNFDFTTWAGSRNRPWLGAQDLSCQTVACAIGHAATIPEFQELGFKLKPEFDSRFGVITFRGKEEFAAVALFFDILISDARYLFSPDKYNSYNYNLAVKKEEVIARLSEFIEIQQAGDWSNE